MKPVYWTATPLSTPSETTTTPVSTETAFPTLQQRMRMSTIGDNSQLKAIVERIEHVEGEIKDLQGDKGEIYQEAKSHGYDCKVLRKVIAFRKKDPSARAEEASLMDAYISALGMEA